MNKDAAFRGLIIVAIGLLAYIAWMNTKEIVDLELEIDRMRGAVGGSAGMVGNPVPPASANDADDVTRASFEETLGG